MKNLLLLAAILLITSPTYGATLGTSASSTDPQRSGEAGTGLFTPGSGAVSISSLSTEMMRVNGSGVGIGTTTAVAGGGLTITPSAVTSGTPALLTITGPADTTLTASTEANDVNINLARTVQFATGNITTQRAVYIQAPTYGFVGTSTITNAATLDISGPPVAGTHATITNPAAVIVESGNVGIGLLAPGFQLEVQNATTSVEGIGLAGNSNTGWPAASYASIDTGTGGRSYAFGSRNGVGFSISDETASAIRMVINASGNVGIGSTSPSVSLDLSQKTDALALAVGTTGQRPTGVNGMIRYNSTTSGLEAYVNGSWVSLGGGVGAVAGSAGQLQCGGANCKNTTGSTTLNYCPYKGNVKTTASQGNYTIPSACLSATITSMYVGGVVSTSVAASTLYYIYLWNTSGTWVLDAETTGHITDSSTGIEIWRGSNGLGDTTKTLVGMIHTDANKKIMTGGKTVQPGDTSTVATWDNRQPTTTYCGFTANRTSTSSSGFTEVNSENRCYFMSWGDAASFASEQNGSSGTNGGGLTTGAGIDTSGSFSGLGLIQNTGGQTMLLVAPGIGTPTEGYHYTTITAQVNAGTTVTFLSGGQANSVYTVQ